jgi:hypothetical protein
VKELRRSGFQVQISPVGGVSITGQPHGLYDFRFFNALVNPGTEPKRWAEILENDEAMDHVCAAAEIFSGDLARLLLEEVTETQGPEALQAVLGRVGDRLANQYRDQVPGQDLSERVQAWAELLDQRGVAVKIERTGEGFVLREYGCPYQNVALESRAVCEMERQVMARLLQSGVKLTQCVLDGHRGCQFTIVEGNQNSR